MSSRRGWLSALLALVLCVSITACGSSTSGSSSSSSSSSSSTGEEGSGSGSGSLKAGENKEIVYFALGVQNAFVASEKKGIEEEAAKLGYTVKTVDSAFEQSIADENVQQYLASGKKPAGILWEPPVSEASETDTVQLSRLAPVVQMLQQPVTKGVAAYSGPNQAFMGTQSAKLAILAREKAKEEGIKLHSPGGNLLYFDYIKGQPAADARWNAFNEATKSEPFNVIGREYNAYDPDTGYETASQVLGKYKSQGIDFMMVFDLQGATGVVKAAEQAGFNIGKETMVISQDCSGGSVEDIENGKVFGSVMEPAIPSGKLAMRTLAQRIATGEVKEGEVTLPESATEPPLEEEVPSEANYLAQPLIVGASDLSNKKYWGSTFAEACNGE